MIYWFEWGCSWGVDLSICVQKNYVGNCIAMLNKDMYKTKRSKWQDIYQVTFLLMEKYHGRFFKFQIRS